jgi:hypothetical protein
LSSQVLHPNVPKRLVALPLQLFNYFPLSKDGGEQCPAVVQLDDDTDSGQQSSSDYESDFEQSATPEYPSLAMVTFRVNSRGELSLSPTGRCPIQITVRSQRAVKKLVRAAMAVSRKQQRAEIAQYRAQQGEAITLDGTNVTVPKARAVIAVSRQQKRISRLPSTTVKGIHGQPVSPTEDQREEESINDAISFPTNLFDVPTDVVDASADLQKYLDAAGFPPGSAVFVPPTGEPLVLTPEGGVVALPTELELSNSEHFDQHTISQSNMTDSQEIGKVGILESLDFAFGRQQSTYSDSGVYENSHHMLHSASLEPIIGSPQTSTIAKRVKVSSTTASPSSICNEPKESKKEHINDTRAFLTTSAGTKREFEALITQVSSKGVEAAIDQLKQGSKDSRTERTDSEPVLTEEEKLKVWQEEFRTMAVPKMEEEWEKYKQHKLQQEHGKLTGNCQPVEKDLDKSEIKSNRLDVAHGFECPTLVSQMTHDQSGEPIGSEYDQSGAKLESHHINRAIKPTKAKRGVSTYDQSGIEFQLARHHIDRAIKPTDAVSNKIACNDEDEDNSSNAKENVKRPVSPSSSNASATAAAGMDPDQMTSHFQSNIDIAATADKEPDKPKRDDITNNTGGRTKKLTKKKSSLYKPVDTSKSKAQQESRAKPNKKSSKGTIPVIKKESSQATFQHLSEDPKANATAKFVAGIASEKKKVNKSNSTDDIKQTDGRVVGAPVHKPPNFKVYSSDTPDEGATDSEALDDLTLLSSEIGASVLTDGYESEGNLQETRLNRVEKRNLAAERRRQEVERKRLEQKEAKRRAAEEEARMEELKRQAEEKLQQQIAEKRRKLREEREAKEQAEREARERHQAEMRKKEMMQRQVEEMKKKVHEELVRRRQEEEALKEAERLAAEAEAKRKQEEEERRLLWEKMLQEEQDEEKRLEMEEQRRREEEEARLLEEKRRQEAEEEKERLQRLEMEKAMAVAQQQWHSKTMLEALNQVFSLRLNQEFTYSYFTFLPYDSLF